MIRRPRDRRLRPRHRSAARIPRPHPPPNRPSRPPLSPDESYCAVTSPNHQTPPLDLLWIGDGIRTCVLFLLSPLPLSPPCGGRCRLAPSTFLPPGGGAPQGRRGLLARPADAGDWVSCWGCPPLPPGRSPGQAAASPPRGGRKREQGFGISHCKGGRGEGERIPYPHASLSG